MDDEERGGIDPLLRAMEGYAEVVETALDARWQALRPKVELYDSETYEVIAGLLARQATLTINLALNPGIWTGHIAPIVLRAMIDTHITLAWIVRSPTERAKQYVLHGLGQVKLFIAHLKDEQANAGELFEDVSEMIERYEAWLGYQRHDFLTEVTLGSWSGLNVRDMAYDSECEGLYKFAYAPFSAAVHSMWNHTSVFNLKHCTNPLHKFHRVPTIARVPLDPDFVYRSAKYVSRSFETVDQAFALAVRAEVPLRWLAEKLNALAKNVGTEGENDGR